MSGLARVTLRLTRLAIRILGPGPVAVAAAATAVLLYLLRRRPRRVRAAATRQPRNRASADDARPAHDTQPAQPGPAWLRTVRRVTLGARFVPGEGDPESHLFCLDDDGAKAVVRPDAVKAVRELARRFKLYVVTEVASDEGEELVTAALREAGLFEPGLLDPRKVLFCETALGRVSVARQIDPRLHLDDSPVVVDALQRFVTYIGLIGTAQPAGGFLFGRNVFRYGSLEQFIS